MPEEKLSISWNDLQTRRVDNRLREQDAIAHNRTYSQMKEDALPEATKPKTSLWNNAVFMMTIFGLVGGLLAWGAEALVAGPLTPVIGATRHYDPDAPARAKALMDSIQQFDVKRATGQLEVLQAQVAADEVRADGQSNAYFRLLSNEQLSDGRRKHS